MLKVENINFFYGEVQVLTNLSLIVKDGEFVALFGPNGHGKSTLLKVISGLLSPQSGTIEYDGVFLNQLTIQKIVNMGIVYIAEDRHLFPDMSVVDNLRMGAYCENARGKEKENLEFVYRLFPKLESLSGRIASSLSGGEARMLAIGRGLMSNPNFLAIDEPSFGLAPNLRVEVFKAINEIRKKGTSILLVEQNTSIAIDYADRIYVIEDGKISFEGDRNTVLQNEELMKVFLGI